MLRVRDACPQAVARLCDVWGAAVAGQCVWATGPGMGGGGDAL